jgi:hypothetical protein
MPVIVFTANLSQSLLIRALNRAPNGDGNALSLAWYCRVLRNSAHRLGRVRLMQPE